VLTELRNRGVADVFFLACDGLKGLPERRVACHDRANLICSHWAGGMVPLVTPRRPGQDLCKPVAFEVRMQTCPAGVVAGLVFASGSSADLSAEMRFRRGRPFGGWRGLGRGYVRDVGSRSSSW
jgi:hypothetical protein